ncbi:AAA domain-containing protein [Tolypothrix sp. VBCCA 56010]|uniref:AAA domain-containing protein n=1 Tax=Tolypothrix sp. VBCCA 56010 TaxID=3137731 RepID=UPI003D7C4749
MNEQQFWAELQQLVYESNEHQETAQAQWQRLVHHVSPPLPTKLIIQTVCNGSVYLTERSPLNLPAITPNVCLSANQQLALEMALSNSAIALIVGSPATGKTRIATSLAYAAINVSKRVLILTHHSAALTAYRNLPGYPFWCQQQDYRNWIIEQLHSQHLAQPQMNYLPLHLLPDGELAKLRTPARLETWLPIIQTSSQQQLTELLKSAFTELEIARVKLLAYRLKQLEPLLQQQLKLSQLYANLSESAITELADQLSDNPQVPILGTVAEFMQPQHQSLWQTTFDLVIVEEAQHLTWLELMLLSTLGHKLVLFGDKMPSLYSKSSPKQSFFAFFPKCFNWLSQHLLPTYHYQLTEQFRLHSEIAKLVYPVICNNWIQTQRTPIDYQLTQLKHRLVWQDVPNQKVGEEIIKFIQSLDPQLSSQIGIITFDVQQRDWLLANSPKFSQLLIGTVAEWAGIERAIVIVSCVGHPENIAVEAINIALTRGQDYLILFGDYDFWRQPGSPLRSFLYQPLHKERTVILS